MTNEGFWIFTHPLLNNKEFVLYTSLLSEQEAKEIFDELQILRVKVNPEREINEKVICIETKTLMNMKQLQKHIDTNFPLFSPEDIFIKSIEHKKEIDLNNIQYCVKHNCVKHTYTYTLLCYETESYDEMNLRVEEATDKILRLFLKIEKLQLEYKKEKIVEQSKKCL